MNKDIKEPLIKDEHENTIQVHQDYQYLGGQSESVGEPLFYANQLDQYALVDLGEVWIDKSKGGKNDLESIVNEAIQQGKTLDNDEKLSKLSTENRNQVKDINILPKIEIDEELMAQKQTEFINKKQVNDPDLVIQMLRLKQLEDAFKTGLKNEVEYDDDKAVIDQHADLVVSTDNELYLIQTIVKNKNPWIYIRAPEREGNDEETHKMIKNDGGDHCDDMQIIKPSIKIRIQQANEDYKWNTLIDPQAKLWIQLQDDIYFFTIQNNWDNKTTEFVLNRFNLNDWKLYQEEEFAQTCTLKPPKNDWQVNGVQFVSFAEVFQGVLSSKVSNIDRAAATLSKQSIQEFLKDGKFCILQTETQKKIQNQEAQWVTAGLVVQPEKMSEPLFGWKQSSPMQQHFEDHNHVNEQSVDLKANTGLSFMLAIWKTSDLAISMQIYMKQKWGAGMIYKMSRGTAKISKQVFWIEKAQNGTLTFDSNRENIDNNQMYFFPTFKKLANMKFQNSYHQIYTLEKTFDKKIKFQQEKLSSDDLDFKLELFGNKIKGQSYSNGSSKRKDCDEYLLSEKAIESKQPLQQQLLMVIQKDYSMTHDKVRAVVIEQLKQSQVDKFCGKKPQINYIKSILAMHQAETIVMEPFEFSQAKPWTQIQYLWSKDYKQVNPNFINLFKDGDNKLRYIEKEQVLQQVKTHKTIKVELKDQVLESQNSLSTFNQLQNQNFVIRKISPLDKETFYNAKFDTKTTPQEKQAEYIHLYGKISSRRQETFDDDRQVYLRQAWGYDKQNKEIFIQVMKKNKDKTQFDEILDETHSYTYDKQDDETGIIEDGFMTTRIKNTAFVPSSAIQKITGNRAGYFQQKYELAIMDETGLFVQIFEYLFQWDNQSPDTKKQLLQLIGRKMLILSYTYQPTDGDAKPINYYPLISGFNFKIEGTHLFSNHKNATIDWNLYIKPFQENQFQFRGQLCSTGYKIFEYSYKEKNITKNKQCALLICTQLTDEIRKLNQDDLYEKRQQEYDSEQDEWRQYYERLPTWGKEKRFQPVLNQIQKNHIFEDQIRVTLNIWPNQPLGKIIKGFETKDQIDYLAPLKIIKGLSFANFLINQPNALTMMMESDKIPKERSIIEIFGKQMKWDSKETGKFKNCYELLLESLPDDKGWIRKEKEMMEDFLFSNPLFRCMEGAKDEKEMQRTQVSANILIDNVINSQNTQVNYNRLIQILPCVVSELAKGIQFDNYAPFFVDFDEENEDPITFAIKIEDQELPKFATKEYNFQRFEISKFPDTDLKDNLIDHLKELSKQQKLEMKTEDDNKNQQKETFDVPVRHFMINLLYLQTSRLIQGYFKGTGDKKNIDGMEVEEHELNQKAYLTEQLFTQMLFDINLKYGDNIADQETMKDILDFIFYETENLGTKRYVIYQVVFYVLFFVLPYLTQLSLTRSEFHNKKEGDYFQSFATYCMLISMAANCIMFSIEGLQMKQSGIVDYFRDDFYNIFDTSMFFIYTAYFFLRITYPIPMLVGSSADLKDIKVTTILMITICFNVLILIQIVIKIFFYLRVNQKFGQQVQLVIQAIYDVGYFSTFMLIWITTFAIYTKVLGSGNSMENQNAGEWGGYPGTNTDFQIWMQTWEDSIGNIQNPSYLFWSSVISNHTAVVSESSNPNYFIDLSDHDVQANEIFSNIGQRTTDFQSSTAIFMIYTIYFFWILNQIFIFIILLNFLIAVISQSYEKVMDGKVVLQYRQRSILNNEKQIVWGSLGLLEKRCDVFYLTSNVESSERGNEWSGFVQNMKKHIGKQTAQVNKNLKSLQSSIVSAQEDVQREIQENELANKRDITRIRDLVKEFTISMQHDVRVYDDVDTSHIEHSAN